MYRTQYYVQFEWSRRWLSAIGIQNYGIGNLNLNIAETYRLTIFENSQIKKSNQTIKLLFTSIYNNFTNEFIRELLKF